MNKALVNTENTDVPDIKVDKEFRSRWIFTSVSLITGLLLIFIYLEIFEIIRISTFDVKSNFGIPCLIGQIVSYFYGLKVLFLRLKSRNTKRKYIPVLGSKIAYILAWCMQTLGTIVILIAMFIFIYLKTYS